MDKSPANCYKSPLHAPTTRTSPASDESLVKLDRAISGSHRNGDLVVTEYDVDGVRTINQALADAFRSSKRFNPHASRRRSRQASPSTI